MRRTRSRSGCGTRVSRRAATTAFPLTASLEWRGTRTASTFRERSGRRPPTWPSRWGRPTARTPRARWSRCWSGLETASLGAGIVPARHMASSTTTPAAPVTAARVPRSAVRLAIPAATIAGVAALLRVVYHPWYLNYDARYALLWAGDLWHGFRPDYGAPFAPTPHPLQTAASFLVYPLGASDQLVTWMILLSFGALVWLVYALGARLFSRWAGVVAA